VTNAYGLIINDLNEYGNPSSGAGALILTNRWGIYQDSTTDVNYFGGTTLIGTTTNAGYKLDVAGTLRNTLGANFATTSGNVGIGTASPIDKLGVVVNTNAASGINISNLSTGSSARTRIALETQGGNWYLDGVRTGGEFAITRGSTEVLRISGAANTLFGTTTDAGQRVQIDSSLRLVPTSTVPTASAGAMYYDSATNKLKLYDGNSWVNLN
jgi:hypothetical protein